MTSNDPLDVLAGIANLLRMDGRDDWTPENLCSPDYEPRAVFEEVLACVDRDHALCSCGTCRHADWETDGSGFGAERVCNSGGDGHLQSEDWPRSDIRWHCPGWAMRESGR